MLATLLLKSTLGTMPAEPGTRPLRPLPLPGTRPFRIVYAASRLAKLVVISSILCKFQSRAVESFRNGTSTPGSRNFAAAVFLPRSDWNSGSEGVNGSNDKELRQDVATATRNRRNCDAEAAKHFVVERGKVGWNMDCRRIVIYLECPYVALLYFCSQICSALSLEVASPKTSPQKYLSSQRGQ